ncbi:hypothetical protein C8R44DRAFT_754302 [Mycena epipterygia]|nr:hypothetical protein C8R44DRAFT_754302 [Mycena epipterygia]
MLITSQPQPRVFILASPDIFSSLDLAILSVFDPRYLNFLAYLQQTQAQQASAATLFNPFPPLLTMQLCPRRPKSLTPIYIYQFLATVPQFSGAGPSVKSIRQQCFYEVRSRTIFISNDPSGTSGTTDDPPSPMTEPEESPAEPSEKVKGKGKLLELYYISLYNIGLSEVGLKPSNSVRVAPTATTSIQTQSPRRYNICGHSVERGETWCHDRTSEAKCRGRGAPPARSLMGAGYSRQNSNPNIWREKAREGERIRVLLPSVTSSLQQRVTTLLVQVQDPHRPNRQGPSQAWIEMSSTSPSTRRDTEASRRPKMNDRKL